MSKNHPHPTDTRTIDKVLIANRGEIALRVMRTCRAMGIATVAVYSDADADMPHVHAADEAVRIGPPPAGESYLAVDKVLGAARLTGADAIHPGYGFLSENAGFAHACAEAGVTFIGPSAMVIGLLGSKRDAKIRAAGAGVPIVPGFNGDEQGIDALAARGRDLGFPLLVKASAGGGGKGMRVVRDAAALPAALESAKREAASAFGDDTLILERYVERPRHVEIQILGDHHGNLIHLWERECSIQRRHQKVIEEAPSPALDEARRHAMGAAGVAVGKAVGYTSAGTVEFIVAPDGAFYFLEVNTRLQVEHPVTEAITGLDLVREQIRIARGEALPVAEAPPIRGHAIEVRLYAEDVDHGYLPTTGRIVDWHLPARDGVRVDAGVRAGTEVGIHYDPMLAKVIGHGATRAEAALRLRRALEQGLIAGVTTNRAFLARVLAHPAFLAGDLDTHFLEHHAADVRSAPPDDDALRVAAIAVTLAGIAARAVGPRPLPHVPPGWRNVRFADEQLRFQVGADDREVAVGYRILGATRLAITALGEAQTIGLIAAPTGGGAGEVVYEDERGLRRRVRVAHAGSRWTVASPEPGGTELILVELPRFPEAGDEAVAGACVAPMPGKVVKLMVAEGDAVAAGQTLLVLEAMKMEHAVKAH
ncbi:MAG: ATP-grasp domain-containing protein, partial [Myxococcales bacterium]|nr:ATP-grasp domain-containing protein [Myxococcales bacterium]